MKSLKIKQRNAIQVLITRCEQEVMTLRLSTYGNGQEDRNADDKGQWYKCSSISKPRSNI